MNKKIIDQYLNNLFEGFYIGVDKKHDHNPQSRKPYASDIKYSKDKMVRVKHNRKQSDGVMAGAKKMDAIDHIQQHERKEKKSIKNQLKNLFSKNK